RWVWAAPRARSRITASGSPARSWTCPSGRRARTTSAATTGAGDSSWRRGAGRISRELRVSAGAATAEAQLARLLLQRQIEEFVYREAEILDERRYEEWLDLFTEDARYWMPMRRNAPPDAPEREFTREGAEVNWFDDGKDTLARRVAQIRTGVHWAEEPPSRI